MKKAIMALVAVCVTAAGFAIGSSAQATANTSDLDCYNGTGQFRCPWCKGSGWNGNIVCSLCKGNGRSNSY